MKNLLLFIILTFLVNITLAQTNNGFTNLNQFTWLCNQNKIPKQTRSSERLLTSTLFELPDEDTTLYFVYKLQYFYNASNNRPNNFRAVLQAPLYDTFGFLPKHNYPKDYFDYNFMQNTYHTGFGADSEVVIYPNMPIAPLDSSYRLTTYDNLNRIITNASVNYDTPADTLSIQKFTYSGTNFKPDSIVVYNGGMGSPIVSFTRFTYLANGKLHTQETNYPNNLFTTYMYNSLGLIESIETDFVNQVKFFYDADAWIDSVSVYNYSIITNNNSIPYETYKYKYSSNRTIINTNKHFYDDIQNVWRLDKDEFKLDANKNIIEWNEIDNYYNPYFKRQILQSFTPGGNLLKYILKGYSSSSWPTALVKDSFVNTYETSTPSSTTELVKAQVSCYLFPNPTNTNAINLYYASDKQNSATINITDVLGRIVHTQKISLVNGNSIIPFNIKNLNSGNYFLTIITKDNINKSLQFVKQ